LTPLSKRLTLIMKYIFNWFWKEEGYVRISCVLFFIIITVMLVNVRLAGAETFPLEGNVEMIKPAITKGYIEGIGTVIGQDTNNDGNVDVFWRLHKKCNITTGCDLYVTRMEQIYNKTNKMEAY